MSHEPSDISRRDVASLLGVLGGALGISALSACSNDPDASSAMEPPTESLARTSSALTGSGLVGTLSVAVASGTSLTLGSALNSAQTAAINNRVYVLVDAYTANCELSFVAGASTTGGATTLTLSPALSKPHSAGASVVILEELVVTPQMFGGVADGMTPATTAIQAAYNALINQSVSNDMGGLIAPRTPMVSAAPGGTLYFPAAPGAYVMTSPLVLAGDQGITIRGDGFHSQIQDPWNSSSWQNAVPASCSGSVILMQSQQDAIQAFSSASEYVGNIVIRDIAILGPTVVGSAPSGGPTTPYSAFNSIAGGGAYGCSVTMQNVSVMNFPVGLQLSVVEGVFRDVRFAGCLYAGVLVKNSTSSTFYNPIFSNCGTATGSGSALIPQFAAVVLVGAQVFFVGGVIEAQPGMTGLYLASGTGESRFADMYIEGTTNAIWLDAQSTPIEYILFENMHCGGGALKWTGSGVFTQATFINCDMRGAGTTVPSAAQYTVFINCQFATTLVDQGVSTQIVGTPLNGCLDLRLTGHTTDNTWTQLVGEPTIPDNAVTEYTVDAIAFDGVNFASWRNLRATYGRNGGGAAVPVGPEIGAGLAPTVATAGEAQNYLLSVLKSGAGTALVVAVQYGASGPYPTVNWLVKIRQISLTTVGGFPA